MQQQHPQHHWKGTIFDGIQLQAMDIVPITFKKGEMVLLITKKLKLKHPKKSLWPKYIRPFCVVKPCGKLAYKLDLPDKW